MKLNKSIEDVLEILNIKQLPKEVEKYIGDSEIYYRGTCKESELVAIKGKDIYIKVAHLNLLKKEYESTRYFNRLDTSAEIIDYIQEDDRDYIIVKEISDTEHLNEEYIKNPEKLAKRIGKKLRELHSLKNKECSNIDLTKLLIDKCIHNVRDDKIKIDMFYNMYRFTPNQGLLMLGNLSHAYINDTFVHGDYTLFKDIIEDFEFEAMKQSEFSGMGDRHYDICRGIFILNKILKCKEYEDILLDSYGRESIDKDRLAFSKLLYILS